MHSTADRYDFRIPRLDGSPDYLAEAAKLLAKAAATNETTNVRYPLRLQEGRERIADKYAQLGAIQRGLLPADLAAGMTDSVREG